MLYCPICNRAVEKFSTREEILTTGIVLRPMLAHCNRCKMIFAPQHNDPRLPNGSLRNSGASHDEERAVVALPQGSVEGDQGKRLSAENPVSETNPRRDMMLRVPEARQEAARPQA